MTSKLTPGASTGRATKLPAIPVVRTGNTEMDKFVLAVKEYIEVRDGVRGNPYDRFATIRDVTTSVETARNLSTTDVLITPSSTQLTTTVSSTAANETAKLRAELARTERNLRDTIAQLASTVDKNALTSQAVQSLSGVNRYTQANLSADLASGAATIIAGATSGNAVMELADDGSYVLFKHKDANVNGIGAGYSGVVRTAVGITAAGFLAGYNRQSDGAWQNSIVLDSATGDVTILGTLRANSVIEVGAYLGAQTVSTVLSDISTAASDASYAASAVTTKLSKNSADILSGTISFSSAGGFKTGTVTVDGAGNATGSGVAITSKGIVGINASSPTFTLNAVSGSATFYGDISGAANINITGNGIFNGNSGSAPASLGTGAVIANSTNTTNSGVVGYGYGLNPFTQGYGIVGYANNIYSGGVYGYATTGTAILGVNAGTGSAVAGASLGSGAAVVCSGPFRFGAYTISTPDGGTDKYLRNDGVWAPVSSVGGGTVTSVSGSGSVSGITLSGTVTSSGSLTLGGSLSLTTGQLTATAPGGSYFLSGGGWTIVNVVSQLNGATGDVTNSFAANNSIAGAAISVSGSGTNSVTYNFSSTSDRSLKKDIVAIDKGLDFINELRPVTYLWDTEYMTFSKRTYGFVANEVRDLLEEESSLVYTNNGGVFDGKLAVDYQSYVPVLVKAVQELSARVAQLEQTHVS